jgi:hypothetical protein
MNEEMEVTWLLRPRRRPVFYSGARRAVLAVHKRITCSRLEVLYYTA